MEVPDVVQSLTTLTETANTVLTQARLLLTQGIIVRMRIRAGHCSHSPNYSPRG